ncbi:Phosphate transport system permease protein PstC [Candidatus Bealeia paramacronuclearis]|uniref:Phosphate transport system permease protein n=2 Tax=Candidatus Bealeia paramacronuclearis TaxID=1921001 RepID=A0ABZ2C6M3_9PROT|nr:Phosphate transport system permease protein PstC [Candidatus Bealeia paramacronuclearis]
MDRLTRGLLFGCAISAVIVTFAIFFSIIFEALKFFQFVSPLDFFLGTHWSPQVSSVTGNPLGFGAIPLFTGTFLITIIALGISAPLGLMSAIYMSEYASSKARHTIKPLLEILAGIPTVIYGFFAAIILAPHLQCVGEFLHIPIASESAINAGVVMGIMILPFFSSLCDDVIHSVPRALRDSALALGSTSSETIMKVVIPAARPGIISAFLLAMSRAVGETMIVVMAAGMAAKLTLNPFASVTTVTVQIVSLLTGDQEFNSPKTLAAFALGLVLFIMTLALNMMALKIVNHYRQKYG